MKRTLPILSSLSLALLCGSAAHARDLPSYDASFEHRTSASHTGAPSFVWGSRGAVSPLSLKTTPAEAARAHVVARASLYGLSKEAIDTARVAQIHDTGRGGIVVVLRQEIGGVPLWHHDAKILLRRDLSLVAMSGGLHPLALDTPKSRGRFALPHAGAVARALSDLYATSVPSSALADSASAPKGEYRRFDLAGPASFAGTIRFERPARVRRVYFALGDRLVPAYRVELFTREKGSGSDVYGYVIAADDGRILARHNLTSHASFKYRVWADETGDNRPFDGPVADFTPYPAGAPNGSAPAFVPPNLITMEGFNKHADPWLPDGATESRGNNVDAYTDHDGSDGPGGGDVRAAVTAPGELDRVYDTSKSPVSSTDQEMAAVTQIFYTTNWLHDYWYDSGFDEAAGNAQAENYGRGGLPGDRLLAEAQDAYDQGATDNANMSTPDDGESPRMQMYVWHGSEERSITTAPLPPDAETSSAEFGPQSFDLTGTVALTDDGTGTTSDGCEAFAGDVSGKIALVDRGQCTFHEKAFNAESAGAIGMILVNNQPGSPPLMPASNFPDITIPVLGVTQGDGAALKTALAGGPVTAALHRQAGPLADGTIDNLIIAHEWGHYLHGRLVGCQLNQCGGEGEGWGDFIALTTQIRPGDDLDGAFSDSTYAASAIANYAYFGVRRYPYSIDMNKNPLTFKHIQQGTELPMNVPTNDVFPDNSEVHNTGEVWASMLFEGFVALLKQSQGATPKYTFEEGRRRMTEYVVTGMLLAPTEPTFTEQRDAIIAAAYAADPDDAFLVAQGFATRGAGSCAVSPPADSMDNGGVVESFKVAPALAISEVRLDDSPSSCDKDGVLDAGETGKVTVTLANISYLAAESTKLTVTSSTQGVAFPNGSTKTFDTLDGFTDQTVSFDVVLGPGTGAPSLIDLTVTAENLQACNPTVADKSVRRVNYDNAAMSSTSDDLESDIDVWTLTGTNADAIWKKQADDKGNHTWHGVDYSTVSDTSLVSPPVEVGAAGDLVLSFKHRHSFEASEDPSNPGTIEKWDGGVIEVTTDGGATWQDLSNLGDPGHNGTIGDQAMNPLSNREGFTDKNPSWPSMDAVTVNLGKSLAGETIQIRFRIGTDQAAGEYGWQIDDIAFQGIEGTPFPAVVKDAQSCTDHAPIANAGPDQTVASGATVLLDGSASSDPDGDPLIYSWSQVEGPAVSLSTKDAALTFQAPTVDQPTALTFALQVSANALSSTDTVRVVVNPPPGKGASDLQASGGGCGCSVPGGDDSVPTAPLGFLGTLTFGILAYRRRRPSSR